MVEGSWSVNVLHSIKTYFDIESGEDVINETIAVIGNRSAHRDPNPVILTQQLPWDWKEFEVSMDLRHWRHGTTTPTMRRRACQFQMLLLPTVLVPFVLEKKRTAFDVYLEIQRCMMHHQDCELLSGWFLAAGQSTSSSKCLPALANKFNAVLTSDEIFAEWCVHRIANAVVRRKTSNGSDGNISASTITAKSSTTWD